MIKLTKIFKKRSIVIIQEKSFMKRVVMIISLFTAIHTHQTICMKKEFEIVNREGNHVSHKPDHVAIYLGDNQILFLPIEQYEEHPSQESLEKRKKMKQEIEKERKKLFILLGLEKI